ncbi:MAG: DUF599 domain-containing protein [Burkholderiales bacterium]
MIPLFSSTDIAALGLFAICWWGFPWYAASHARSRPSLGPLINNYRREWMVEVLSRDMRMVDTSILASLGNSATFFSSTTILILGGLLAMLSTSEEILAAIGKLPLAVRTTAQIWEMKVMLMLAIFTYAFFKFTWSLRQFNFVSMLVGAAPAKDGDLNTQQTFAKRAGSVLEHAGEAFSEGLRAYYFSLAALTWFVHPLLFMLATAWVVGILYYLEFKSDAVETLRR